MTIFPLLVVMVAKIPSTATGFFTTGCVVFFTAVVVLVFFAGTTFFGVCAWMLRIPKNNINKNLDFIVNLFGSIFYSFIGIFSFLLWV
jgi:hypothetical protein